MIAIEALDLGPRSKGSSITLAACRTCSGVALITDVWRAPNGTCSTGHCVARPRSAPSHRRSALHTCNAVGHPVVRVS